MHGNHGDSKFSLVQVSRKSSEDMPVFSLDEKLGNLYKKAIGEIKGKHGTTEDYKEKNLSELKPLISTEGDLVYILKTHKKEGSL